MRESAYPVKFPKTARKSTADDSSMLVLSGQNNVFDRTAPPQTAEHIVSKSFGLGVLSLGDSATTKSGQ